MVTIPARFGPMKYLPSEQAPYKAVKYLCYNWFLCSKHWKAIGKIDAKANEILKDSGHIWSKNYHRAMILFLATPVIGHLIAFLEAFFHRVDVEVSCHQLADETYGIDVHMPHSFHLPDDVKRSEAEGWVDLLKDDPSVMKDVPEKLRENLHFAYMAVSKNSLCLEKFSQEIKKNKTICLMAVCDDVDVFDQVDDSLKEDRSFLLACVEYQGVNFFKKCVPAKFQASYDFCFQAVARNVSVLEAISDKFKKREQLVLEAFADYVPYTEDSIPRARDAKAWYSVPSHMQTNLAFVLKILEKNGLVLEFLDYVHQNDPEYVLTAIKNNYLAYQFASHELKNDASFFLQALEINPKVIEFAADKIKNNRVIGLMVVSKDGRLIRFLHPDLRKDKEVAHLAINVYGDAFEHVDPSLQDDFDLAVLALKDDSAVIKHVGLGLRANREFILKAVAAWFGSLRYAIHAFKKDKEIVLVAIRHDGAALDDADDSLKNDKYFIIQVLQECRLPERAWSCVPDKLKDDPEVKEAYRLNKNR